MNSPRNHQKTLLGWICGFGIVAVFLFSAPQSASAGPGEFPQVTDVDRQPLVAATKRLVEALKYVGAPLSPDDSRALQQAMKNTDDSAAIESIQKVLDSYCVAGVHINAESRVSVAEGPVEKQLVQQGWRTFLVKVHNEAGITPQLKADSPNAAPLYMRGKGSRQRPQKEQDLVDPSEIPNRWLDFEMYNKQPLKKKLSGLEVEYRIIQLYSRDAGKREAKLGFNVGQGTQDIGFRNTVPILFQCEPAVEVTLDVRDFDGNPTTASFVFRDQLDRVYPNPARRLAPDFFFHNQIYRADGENVLLPPGKYTVEVSRGPEYPTQTRSFQIPNDVEKHNLEFQLQRWIHPAARGWFSGDHHVHAAGCAHYDSPTEGVKPSHMMRHILGEDLNVGCVLSWGPCWYTQKQYFEGKPSSLSRPNYVMRYDVEVSGFPSSHCGHLCLLRLKEDDYPGTTLIEEWPSWTLPILQWGKQQDAVVGYSHSGWGLQLPDYGRGGNRVSNGKGRAADKLPDYAMPPFDGIGANEFVVTVAHNACDFISSVDTPAVWELNVWYHTLNCGFRSRISGETDFPCIYGDKVGLGRVYVKLAEGEQLTYDNWIRCVQDGRSYCGDGRSHVFDFQVGDVKMGEPGSKGKISQLNLQKPGKVNVSFDVTARLSEEITPETERLRNRRLDAKPYWHIERARIGQSRKVPVEVIVNGVPQAKREIVADGTVKNLSFGIDIPHSSWVAVRIFPSVHTNPVFVKVADKPIRASRRSAEWCRRAVDVCWNSKKDNIREEDRPAAKAAYDKARQIYEKIEKESVAE